MGGYAWVTLATNNSYSLGALVLAHSLKKANTAHKLVVLITPAVSQSMRDQLQTVFDVVKVVDVLDSKDEAHLALLKRPDLGITFTKIHCWRLVEFDKCVFLDADTLVVRNCDELFEKEEFSAAPDVSWPDCFNSGVFVYRPSIETFNKLLQFAVENRSFDGGDQGLLNQFFSDWATEDIKKHLPFVYNLTSIAAYSYIPAFKHYGSETRIVHFIGSGKPWLQQLDATTRTVTPPSGSEHLAPLLQQWWDLFCEKVHPNLDKNLESSNDGMSQPLVEARSNFLPIALTDEPQTALLAEPCTPYREKDDFRQHNLPYLPFHVKGPSGELLNVEFLSASVVPPQFEEEQQRQEKPEEQQRQEKAEEQQQRQEKAEEQQRQEKAGEEQRQEKAEELQRHEKPKENEQMEKQNERGVAAERENERSEDKPREKTNEEKVEVEQNEQQQQQHQQQQEDPPPKDPFDYHSFFPDETCISSYLEKNVVTYQPYEHREEKHNPEPEPEISCPSLPRFLTIPQNDQRQSGNTDAGPQPEREPPTRDEPRPAEREATPPREVEPVAEKRELAKSKSMSCFPCDVGKVDTPPRDSIWKSQPNLNVDPNRKYSMPRLKPILPKQRSFSKSIPSEIPKVTLYTEFLISSEYKDPADLPNDRIGFVETHIHGKLRRSKSDADIPEKFGPLPYTPSPEVEKPASPPTRNPRRHFDQDYYDFARCKRQMGNKPKPKEAEKRKESVHCLPALKPIVPGKDKKSILIKKRKSKELSPGDGGREKIPKRESKKLREKKRESRVGNPSTDNGNGNNLEEILQRLRAFSKDYQHFFGAVAKPKAVTCRNAAVQASEEEEFECGSSEAFETFPRFGSRRSRETQTARRGTSAVEGSEFRQFRNYVKDQKETSQKGLLGIQDILSEGESVSNSITIENKVPVLNAREKGSPKPKATGKQVDGSNPEEIGCACRNSSPSSNAELDQQEVKPNIGANHESNSEEAPETLECRENEQTVSPRPSDSAVVLESQKDVLIKRPIEKGNHAREQSEAVSANGKPTAEPIVKTTRAQQAEVSVMKNDGERSEKKSSVRPEAKTDLPNRKGEPVAGRNSTEGNPVTKKTANGHVTHLSKPGKKMNVLKSQQLKTAEVSRQDEKIAENGGDSVRKREEILCVPDFDTPRTSRVSLPTVAPATAANGTGNGLDDPPDNSPGGTVRFVGKGKSAFPSSSPSPLPITPPCGNAMSESFEDLKSKSGIAGAIAQLSLEAGAAQRPESGAASAAHEEYLRRQNWETGNMDYMGRDSFDNIWSKICETIEAKELEEKAAGSSPKPTEKLPESTETPKTVQNCPEYIETLPGEPAAGPVEDDEIIFSKSENRQSCLTNIAEEEEAGTEGIAGRSVKLSDILQAGVSAGQKIPNAGLEKTTEVEKKAGENKAIPCADGQKHPEEKQQPEPKKSECKTAAIIPQPAPGDGQRPLEGKPETTFGGLEPTGSLKTVPSAEQPTAAPPTAVAPPTPALPTATPPTAAPPTVAAPPTAVPPTTAVPTVPSTTAPPTAAAPMTPPTTTPPTAAPPTAVPPTAASFTVAAPTAPPTATPPTAAVPSTAAPPTGATPPTTAAPTVPSTTAPPTAAAPMTPPTTTPPTAAPPTDAAPPTAAPSAAVQPECKTVAIVQSADGAKHPEGKQQPEPEKSKAESQKKAEECTTVAIPSPPIFFSGSPLVDKPRSQDKKTEAEKPEVKSEPIPLPPPETRPTVGPPQEATSRIARSESPKEEGKQKKGVFSKILEMVGVAPKEKNGSEASKSVFYDVDEIGQPKQETEKKTEETEKTGKATAEGTESGAAVQPEDKKFPTSKPEETKIEGKSEEEKAVECPEKSGPMAKPARSSSPKQPGNSIHVLPTRKSPSPKLTIPPKLPETEVTMPTPPPHPEVPPRRNSALLKVDETILETPPVVESAREAMEEVVKGKVTTEIEDIIGKAKSEVESLLQDRRSAEKEAGGESSDLINTMKLLMGGGDEAGKSRQEEVEELRVTSEEERMRHKGEAVTSKLSDQILKAIPPPRRKAISEASASTGAIPKATAEQKSPAAGESKAKPSKPSAIPVPPPRNKGKPTAPAPPKPKAKK